MHNYYIKDLFCAGAIPYFNSYFGRSSGPIILDRVTCTRLETNILECVHGGIGVVLSSCNRYNQVGVQCLGKVLQCIRYLLSLSVHVQAL